MPTPYVKQTWVDGVAGGTPISAARLAYIESGIENATLPDSAYVSSADGAFVPATADAMLFVSPSGNDANNGKSWGKAKLTIQAAHDALPATGGTIKVSAGTIAATTAPWLVATKPDVTIEGLGSLTKISRSYSPALTVSNTAHRFRLANVDIKHDGDNNGVAILQVDGATDCEFEGIVFDASSATIDFGGFLRLTDSPRSVIKDCRVIGANGVTRRVSLAFELRGASPDCRILNNVVAGCRIYGIDVRGSSTGCRIIGNRVSDVGTDAGIKVWVGNTLVAGNQISGTGGSCIDINGDSVDNPTGGPNYGCVVIGNDCTGDRINLEWDVHEAVIANNVIRNSRGYGIGMIRLITDIDIVGNVVINAAHATHGGITVVAFAGGDSARINIQGNEIRGCTNAAIFFESGTNSFVGGNFIANNAKGIQGDVNGSVRLGINRFVSNTTDLTGTFITDMQGTIRGGNAQFGNLYAGNAVVADGVAGLYLKGTEGDGRANFVFHNSSAGGHKFNVTSLDTGGLRVYNTTTGSTELLIQSFNLSVPNGHVTATGFRVAGNQVVGARGAAVADATDAATAITQLNALLARLRTHGLIAP